MIDLTGKWVVVTGSTKGIGKGIAEAAAKAGAHVVVVGTNQERGETVAKSLGNKAFFKALDVASFDACHTFIDEVLAKTGQIDVLINNAGITRDNLLMKMKEEDWDSVLEVNLKSVFNLSHALCRSMLKARSGKIINISSVVGLTGNAGQVNYSASKAGVIGATKALAQEMAGRGICVNCIAPGFIETEMTEGLPETVKTAILNKIPMKRMGNTNEIANAALFLASDLSSYITGQVLTVDGGMVM